MKKSLLVAAASVLALVACSSNGEGGKNADPSNPVVSVAGGKITVAPEPLQFAKDKHNVKITWQLPAGTPYTFPKDGIVIGDGGDEFPDCHPEQNGQRFACMNKHNKPGKYKYTIKVDGSPAVPPLDPIVINE
jgi:hypothetical protein